MKGHSPRCNMSRLREQLKAYEAYLVREALYKTGYNVVAASAELGISTKTLYAKLIEHDINLPPKPHRLARGSRHGQAKLNESS